MDLKASLKSKECSNNSLRMKVLRRIKIKIDERCRLNLEIENGFIIWIKNVKDIIMINNFKTKAIICFIKKCFFCFLNEMEHINDSAEKSCTTDI